MKEFERYTVCLFDKPLAPRGKPYEIICELVDGYCGFLNSLLANINQKTGKEIIGMNGAVFGEDDLKELSQLIVAARKQVEGQEEIWDISLGYSPMYKKDMRFEVSKFKTNLLDQLESAVRKAKSNGSYIHINFWGMGGNAL